MACPRLFSRVIRLVVILVCFCPLAWGQGPPAATPGPSSAIYDITGFVKSDVDDQPVQGARLKLFTLSNNLAHATVLSSATGEFRFGGSPGGEYFVEAESEGFETARVRIDVSLHGDEVMVRLRPLPRDASRGAPANAVLVRNATIPEKAFEAFQKGVTLLTIQSDYRGAIVQFERATKAFPGYYEAFAQMGVAYDRLGETAFAEQALRKSIEISSSKYAESLFLLAQILNDQNRFPDAEKTARQGIAAAADSPKSHYELARALAGLKRDTEAEESAVKARTLKPDSPPVHLLLANIHRRLHNYPALLEDLDAYLELAPSGPASDQAKTLREQVKKALEAGPK
ncbi:MAG TPA: carboxypeptidase regulatory-like domain-containing protein [Candidatus Acidoferrum sp.]|nr:carboxypeptidase regulatory-like domain-containing protein [Candidatus Acidoferrum sp.]